MHEDAYSAVGPGIKVQSMLDKLSLWFASICILLGAVLLYDGVSNSDMTQTARIIAGAAFLALGFTTLWFATKSWVEWRRNYKRGGR